MMSPEELARRFDHHPPPRPEIGDTHARVREVFKLTAAYVDNNVPDGREKALVLTKLEEALFWTNAAIARDPAAVLYRLGIHPNSDPVSDDAPYRRGLGEVNEVKQ